MGHAAASPAFSLVDRHVFLRPLRLWGNLLHVLSVMCTATAISYSHLLSGGRNLSSPMNGTDMQDHVLLQMTGKSDDSSSVPRMKRSKMLTNTLHMVNMGDGLVRIYRRIVNINDFGIWMLFQVFSSIERLCIS